MSGKNTNIAHNPADAQRHKQIYNNPAPGEVGSGDMLKSIYDPAGVSGDAFDSANTNYDNSTSGAVSSKVEGAINESYARIKLLEGEGAFTSYADPILNAITQSDVDDYRGAVLTLTAAGNNQTLPSPTDTAIFHEFTVINNDTSTDSISIIGASTIVLDAGKSIKFTWEGTVWVASDSEGIWYDDGTDVKTQNSTRNVDFQDGGLKDTNVITAVKLGDGSNIALNTTNKTILGGINEVLAGIEKSNIIYVGKHGNDANSGLTLNLAKLTFSAAITTASALTPSASNRIAIVCYDAGVYTEAVLIIPSYVSINAPNATFKPVGVNNTIQVEDEATLVAFEVIQDQGAPAAIVGMNDAGIRTIDIQRITCTGSSVGVINYAILTSGQIDLNVRLITIESGAAISDASLDGRISVNVNAIIITGNNGKGVSMNGAGKITGKIGFIIEAGTPTGTIGLDVNSGTHDLICAKIVCDTVYDVSAGAFLNLHVAECGGTETNAGTLNLVNGTCGIDIIGDIKTAGNFIGELGETKEPTGFTAPENVIITGDSTTRTVTLTGTVNAYYRGVLNSTIATGWTSPAHDNTTTKVYALTYNGTDIDWRDLSAIDDTDFFSSLIIAIAFYNSNDAVWVYQRECHGLQPWQSHRSEHKKLGTSKDSGGTLADYVLNSTTIAERRPSISSALIYDEDLPTTVTALPVNTYTQGYLSGAGGTFNFITAGTDIVPLSTNRPYWNEFTGGAWQQTLIDNGDYMNIWLIAIPTAADTESQKLRYIWVQGQQQFDNTTEAAAETPNDVNLGTLTELTPELVYISKVTIRYIGGNWKFISVTDLTGTKLSQSQSPTGNYLSAVTSDITLTGIGTSGDPLGLNLSNSNEWTAAQSIKVDSDTAHLVEKADGTDVWKINTNTPAATLDGTLYINGDIIQNGASYETHTEQLYTKKDIIITRDGAISGLAVGEYTGIQANLYDGTNSGQLVFDKDGIARVGDVGSTVALAGREDTPTANRISYWDSTTSTFKTDRAIDVDASANISIPTGSAYKINNVSVINATTLGSAVVNSSLTSVGTLNNLAVDGAITGTAVSETGGNSKVIKSTSAGNVVLTGGLTAVGVISTKNNDIGLYLPHGATINDYSSIAFGLSGAAGKGAEIRSRRYTNIYGGNEGDLGFFTNVGNPDGTTQATEKMTLSPTGNLTLTGGFTAGGKIKATLATYANNAAAISAGLVAGDMYKVNSAGSEYFVAIVV